MTEKPSAMGTGKKSTRFKPGQSGNPAGRPRKEKYPIRYQGHFRKTMLDNLNQTLTITRDGKSEKVSALEAVLQKLLLHAINSKTSAAIKMYIELCAICFQEHADWEMDTARLLMEQALPLTGETYYQPSPPEPPPAAPEGVKNSKKRRRK
jgi:hypothetical protein